MVMVVLGGQGRLVCEVVLRLETAVESVSSAIRRTGVVLDTVGGLVGALKGAECVVHTAVHRWRYRTVNLGGTRRLINMLAGRPGPPHVIYISIVGCDRSPFRFYRAKYASELVLQRSKLPVTVVRATQFHALVATVARAATLGSVGFVPRGMLFQPCDHRWVAAEIVDMALGPAPSGYYPAADLAGPERLSLADAAALVRVKEGKAAPRLITLPPIGGTLRAYEAGAHLPGPDSKIGGSTFREFLDSSSV